MRKLCPQLFLRHLSLLLLITSCSLNRFAVNSSSGLLYSASNEVEAESNYELFKLGVPANLILMEGLLSESPSNLDILATLTKGYAGYAFAVNETQMQDEEWGELKIETGRNQALLNYTRGMTFGFRYLAEQKIELKDLLLVVNEKEGVPQLLDKHLSKNKRDLDLVLFTAQSYGALINLQKDNISLISELSVVKSMFDWVCKADPQINFGTCDIFYGAFEAGRPKMLGGNPEKGKEIFLKAITLNPDNWLIRTSYMQYYLIPQNDKAGFDEQLLYLKKRAEEFSNAYVYRSLAKMADNDWMKVARLRFYQALALKKMELMNKYQKQLF